MGFVRVCMCMYVYVCVYVWHASLCLNCAASFWVVSCRMWKMSWG